jgi:hypothetical protein
MGPREASGHCRGRNILAMPGIESGRRHTGSAIQTFYYLDSWRVGALYRMMLSVSRKEASALVSQFLGNRRSLQILTGCATAAREVN